MMKPKPETKELVEKGTKIYSTAAINLSLRDSFETSLNSYGGSNDQIPDDFKALDEIKQFAADNNIRKTEAAIVVGRSIAEGKSYQETLESFSINQSTQKHNIIGDFEQKKRAYKEPKKFAQAITNLQNKWSDMPNRGGSQAPSFEQLQKIAEHQHEKNHPGGKRENTIGKMVYSKYFGDYVTQQQLDGIMKEHGVGSKQAAYLLGKADGKMEKVGELFNEFKKDLSNAGLDFNDLKGNYSLDNALSNASEAVRSVHQDQNNEQDNDTTRNGPQINN